MTAAGWGFLGVVIGGLLTIGGQATAELVKAHVAKRERKDRRNQLAREFQRATLIELQTAMVEYRAALVRDSRQTFPTDESEAQLAAARSGYQMLLHRVGDETARDVVRSWETEAQLWFQHDDRGSAGAESSAWTTAMRRTGEAVRGTD